MRYLTLICAFSLTLFLTSCSMSLPNDFVAEVLPSPSAKPPLLAVHIVDENAVVHMDIETYVAGVVAGEMPNTWPMEALKAQAILARTFVLSATLVPSFARPRHALRLWIRSSSPTTTDLPPRTSRRYTQCSTSTPAPLSLPQRRMP